MQVTSPSSNTRAEIVLLDNGSLRAGATLALRAVAAQLSARLGTVVQPVSLLHSEKVSPDQLAGMSAVCIDSWMEKRRMDLRSGPVVILPYFIGPSLALTDFLAKKCANWRQADPTLNITVASCLAEASVEAPAALAAMLADAVKSTANRKGWTDYGVVVVDHGTPVRAVNAVRNDVTDLLALHPDLCSRPVIAASMERRAGEDYAFNEPLLETALRPPLCPARRVIVAMLFLSPGRHAGDSGDVATILREAEAASGGALVTAMTPLLGEHPALLDLLEKAYESV
jgi:sirohydrochlorin ferrochelatase